MVFLDIRFMGMRAEDMGVLGFCCCVGIGVWVVIFG